MLHEEVPSHDTLPTDVLICGTQLPVISKVNNMQAIVYDPYQFPLLLFRSLDKQETTPTKFVYL